MAALSSLFLLAAASAAPADGGAQFQAKTGATVAAQATVRIVSGSRVKLGQAADNGGYHVTKASVRVEDGTRREAELVEFQ
jgi:hypothetical protein